MDLEAIRAVLVRFFSFGICLEFSRTVFLLLLHLPLTLHPIMRFSFCLSHGPHSFDTNPSLVHLTPWASTMSSPPCSLVVADGGGDAAIMVDCPHSLPSSPCLAMAIQLFGKAYDTSGGGVLGNSHGKRRWSLSPSPRVVLTPWTNRTATLSLVASPCRPLVTSPLRALCADAATVAAGVASAYGLLPLRVNHRCSFAPASHRRCRASSLLPPLCDTRR